MSEKIEIYTNELDRIKEEEFAKGREDALKKLIGRVDEWNAARKDKIPSYLIRKMAMEVLEDGNH